MISAMADRESAVRRASMWTSLFADLSPEDAVGEIGRAGWVFAELSHEHSLVLLEHGKPDRTGKAFAAHAQGCGVAVNQGHLDLLCDIGPDNEADRAATVQNLKSWLDLYCAVGIKAAVIHPGRAPREERAGRIETVLKSVAELAEHIRRTGMSICLENIPSGKELEELIPRLDEKHVGVCLDTGHLNMTAEKQGTFMRHFQNRLRALHLSDNDGSADQHMLPFGRQCTVPWREVAEALEDIGYAGTLNYEIPGERACPLEIRRLKLRYLLEQTAWIFGEMPGKD